MVTMRVDELASAAALKPSRMARRDAKRNTAMATLNTVSAVRRLLRRALFRISPRNFIESLSAISYQPSAIRVQTVRPQITSRGRSPQATDRDRKPKAAETADR